MAVRNMDRAAAMKYLGITEDMLSWLGDPNVNNYEMFKLYAPQKFDEYAYDVPRLSKGEGAYKYEVVYFEEAYEKDDSELVDITTCISLTEDTERTSASVNIIYEFQRYPMPDVKEREIPTLEKLAELEVSQVYTEDDLRMAKAWIAARDKVISSTKLSGIDLMKPTSIEDMARYCDGFDGFYFNSKSSSYVDSYSSDVLEEYNGDEGTFFILQWLTDYDYGQVGTISSRARGTRTFSIYEGKGRMTIEIEPVDYVRDTANLSAIMPDMLYRMVGSDSKALLRVLGVDQEMLDWLREKQDGGEYAVLYELFGRSDPWYWGENRIQFSRFVEGTDGGTVCIEVGIDIPEDGKGFERAVITYTYY